MSISSDPARRDSDSAASQATGSGPVADLVGTYRSRQDLLHAQQRELAALEQQIFEAAERESQQIIANARNRVRTVLLEARRELLVLTAQVAASREHSRGPAPEFPNVVRAVIGSARPEIESLEAEASALRATFRQIQPAIERASPLVPEPPLPRETARAIEPSLPIESPIPATILVDVPLEHEAEARDREAHSTFDDLISLSMPAAPAGGMRLLIALGCVAVLGAAAVFWWQRPARQQQPAIQSASVSGAKTAPVRDPRSAAADTRHAAPSASAQAPGRPGATNRTIVIETRRPVWLRVNVDDKTDPGRLVPAGEHREIRADRVSIRAGDAGAVVVSINGGASQPLGRDGIALTRDFALSPSARQTAAPAPVPDPPLATASTNGTAGTASRPPSPPSLPAAPASLPVASPSAKAPVTPPVLAEGRSGTPVAAGVPAEVEIMRAAETWFSAFFRRDQSGMTQAGGRTTVIDDQRGAADVPSPALSVRRTFEQGSVQVVGNSAMYTGRLIETAPGGDRFVSLVSQVWLRSGTSWQLLNVRLSSESHVREALR